MGFRFRKSINLGGGFRANISKSGIGYSWGTKGIRFGRTASGKRRTSVSIPGTGLQYVSESGSTNYNAGQQAPPPSNTPEPDNNGGTSMLWVRFIICLFFGYFGVHKFMEKKTGMGFLYLFTLGLFGMGWLWDSGKYLFLVIRSMIPTDPDPGTSAAETQTASSPAANHPVELPPVDLKKIIKTVLLWILTIFFLLMGVGSLVSGNVLTGLLAAAFVALVIPIDSWQALIRRFITGKLKPAIAAVLAVLFFVTAPAAEPSEVENTIPTTIATESASETTATPTTEATTEPVTEAATEPATETTTEPATEVATEATTEASTEPATEATTEPATEATTEPATEATTEPATEAITEAAEDNGQDYVINTNSSSLRFHYPWCGSVDTMNESNKWFFHGTREEIIEMGYIPCGRCHP